MTYKEKIEADYGTFNKNILSKSEIDIWDCSLFLTQKTNYIILDCIFVLESEQKKGIGRSVIAKLCQFADKHNLEIYLQVSNLYGTPKDVLVKFYKSFGFYRTFSFNQLLGIVYMRKSKK